MKWFRLYTDILDDPKIKCMDDNIFRNFIYLLCLACETEKDGLIPYSKEEIAWRLRVTVTSLCDALVTLTKCHIVTDNGDGIKFLHWKKRQYKSDSSAERTRRYREKRKDVTSPKRHMKRHSDGTEQNRAEQNRERTEQKTPPIVPLNYSFKTFWDAYPKKVAKGDALKAWKKLKPDQNILDKILSALEWQAKSTQWLSDAGKYIPYPATYLNQRRWEDEPMALDSLTRKYGEKGVQNILTMKEWLDEKSEEVQ